MTSIFVAKLDFGIGNEDLKQAFARFGTVNKATVAMDRETGKSRGFGFVEMANPEEAQAAIQALDGSLLNGRPIAVKEAEQRGDSRPSRDNSTRNQQRPDRDHAPRPDRNAASTGEYRPKADSSTASFIPAVDIPKIEPKRKKDDKKSKSWDDDKGAKKPKMNAYKKSNKQSRFFDDDDEDDFDLHSIHAYDEDDESLDFDADEEDED